MQTQNKKVVLVPMLSVAGRPIHSTVELKKRIASLNTQVHYRNHKLKEKSARIVELLKENKELKYQLEQATNDLDITQTLLNSLGYTQEISNSYREIEELHEQIMKQFKKDNLFVTLKKWITKTK